ncbi:MULTISPECIES: tRNA (N6-threonylcarbamoyladenosine(37)-N6)-methyltransferase TrmO [Nitrincola]|uniref:TsaA-like domain-containing protein n=1 Tax=Nitrincola nitratireducens TaxID=1229521 RepID=W9V3V9_9GAMM|nr:MULTISPECIES: tRNA (N6-threonylcarbamoyladenosine(37)-N6)-methyltransferase TrmO [Nitrincola]EXJ11626.1 hypothetical protein D791_01399 [Nitrincola nitratireducens]
MSLTLDYIGQVHSPFKEKFGIPRQPGLANTLKASIEIWQPYGSAASVKGLEDVSHIWVIFAFSATAAAGWKASVRPPRLGGNEKMGVFATRSTFRPNPIGLSAVKLDGVRIDKDKVWLDVSGADLLDGTPVLDIKPYLPYSDCLTDAELNWAADAPDSQKEVVFSASAIQVCDRIETSQGYSLKAQIEDVLRLDPRPSYKSDKDERIYGLALHEFNIRWKVEAQSIQVLSIDALDTRSTP